MNEWQAFVVFQTSTLVFYTGYKLQELKDLILELNPLLTSKRNSDLATIRDKYKH